MDKLCIDNLIMGSNGVRDTSSLGQQRMKARFRQDKATELASMLLDLKGGKMEYMKLIKLMYLADRAALLRWGRPISYDSYVSMDNGPVLSSTLDLVNAGDRPGEESIWNQHVSAPKRYHVKLKKLCPPKHLSRAEENLISEIFDEFGHVNQWDLVDWMHDNLPEWNDPDGSSLPIRYHDILMAGGKTEIEADAVESELESVALIEQML